MVEALEGVKTLKVAVGNAYERSKLSLLDTRG